MLGKLRALLAPVLDTPAADSGRKPGRPRYFVPALEGLEGRLMPAAVLQVTTRADVVAADGKRSLREAINRANATPERDTIVLGAGVYKIARAGAGETAADPIDPLLGPLADNGGPTHALLRGSRAIDAGDPASVLATTDQRGVHGPRDGNGDGLRVVDIGAFEK